MNGVYTWVPASSTVTTTVVVNYDHDGDGVQNHMGDSYNFYVPVSAYRIIDDPSSGLLPGIQPLPGKDGEGDHRIMAYNFRLCTTDDPENMQPWSKPEGYDEKDFEMLLRAYDKGYVGVPWHGAPMPNRKFDANSGGCSAEVGNSCV